ncbi:MAG: hypothetical protein KHZ90_09625 [Veillonella parvula]|uniref:Uncharacterized protein n=1 Tax=Veillonella parvula TaxID=29466 RepID=A0A942WNK2_VEIPA|nr:hypothetical protein [Veillonella parvula]MBS4894014.1 hypothetical protein [Veillonella parvula]
MKKSDLKSGMVIEWKEGNKFLIVDQLAFGRSGTHSLNTYTEDLKDNLGNISYDIVKVYIINNENISLNSIFDENYLNLIWQREREIDWSKVPTWTKVRCKQECGFYNAYHYEYIPNEINCLGCTTRDKFTFNTDPVVDYLSRKDIYEIHPSVEIKEEWYK